MTPEDSTYDRGMKVRREVLGDEHVDRTIGGTTEFTADFQDFITRYAWGEIWSRPGLDRKTRSCITLTALVALGRLDELELHVRAAVRNGLTPEEIGEVFLQSAVYCGAPAANSAFAVAGRVLSESSSEPFPPSIMGGVSGGRISGKTRLLALIGHPVGHSLSPAMHNAAFVADGLDFVYVCLDVDPHELPAAVRGLEALKLRGFNVTMPHKRAMIPLVDELDEEARISGALNTVVIEGSALRGFNTDGGGMVMACQEAGIELSGRSVLLLGAGGTAAAIAVAFGKAGAGELHIANRSVERAAHLRDKLLGAGMKALAVHHLDALPDAEIVINTTPLGMKEGDPIPVPPDYVREGRAFCDAVYRPGTQTPLVRLARERDVPVVAGDRMLLYQGVLAQELWTGREPNVKAMDLAIS
jgi:shikimate dehydrogenase